MIGGLYLECLNLLGKLMLLKSHQIAILAGSNDLNHLEKRKGCFDTGRKAPDTRTALDFKFIQAWKLQKVPVKNDFNFRLRFGTHPCMM